jgi:hypothetical protein
VKDRSMSKQSESVSASAFWVSIGATTLRSHLTLTVSSLLRKRVLLLQMLGTLLLSQ